MTIRRTKSGLMGVSATPNFFRFQRASNGDLSSYAVAFVPHGFAAGGTRHHVDSTDPNPRGLETTVAVANAL